MDDWPGAGGQALLARTDPLQSGQSSVDDWPGGEALLARTDPLQSGQSCVDDWSAGQGLLALLFRTWRFLSASPIPCSSKAADPELIRLCQRK